MALGSGRAWMHMLLLILLLTSTAVIGGQQRGERLCLEAEGFPSPICGWSYNPQAERGVVLLHGLGGSAREDWRSQIVLLAQDFHVLAIELPGFTHPSRLPEHYTVAHFAQAVGLFTDHYMPQPYTLIGHSLGGLVALRLARSQAEQARLERMVLIGVPGILDRLAYSREVVGTRVRGQGGSHGGRPALLEKFTIKLLSALEALSGRVQPSDRLLRRMADNPVAMAAMQMVTEEFQGQLGGLALPVLLLWGEDDESAPLRIATLLNASLPNARLLVFSGQGHVPMVEDSQRFNRALTVFVSAGLWPLAAEASPNIPSGPVEQPRHGHCFRESGKVFRGYYSQIQIHSCERVVIEQVRAESITIHGGRVEIRHSRIGREESEVALRLHGSDVKLTNSYLQGQTGIDSAGSRIDLAGVVFEEAWQPLNIRSGTELLLSHSEWRRLGRMQPLHGNYTLERGDVLPWLVYR